MPASPRRTPDHSEVLDHLLLGDAPRGRTSLAGRVEAGELVRIRRGCHVDADYLMAFPESWQRAEVVMVARIVGCARAWPRSTVVAGSSALLNGLPRARPYQDVHLVAPPSSCRGSRIRHLQAVEVRGRRIAPPGRLVIHPGGIEMGLAATVVDGVRALDVTGSVVSVVVRSPDEEGFVTACEGLRRLSRFDRRTPELSRLREATVRGLLLDRLDALPTGTRNLRRARWVVRRADAACDSVAEERLLHILRSAGVRGLRTQYLVVHPSGRYYLDIGIPGLLLDIEFDGARKYVEYSESVERALFEQRVRQHELEQLGWIVVRFAWPDLDSPVGVVRTIRGALRRHGRDLDIDPAMSFAAVA
jgi:very-short-patch-repair endonuclease